MDRACADVFIVIGQRVAVQRIVLDVPLPDFSGLITTRGNKKGPICAEGAIMDRLIMPSHKSVFSIAHSEIPYDGLTIIATRHNIFAIGTESTTFNIHLVSGINVSQFASCAIPELDEM